MFASLSFKKFQRRIRSPFTFLKKLTKKQRKSHKRQVSRKYDIQDKAATKEISGQDTLAALPALDVKIPATSDAIATSASDSGVFLPPTPKSSDLGSTSRVHAFKRALPEIVDEVVPESSAEADITLGPIGEKDAIADISAVVANHKDELEAVDVKDVELIGKKSVATDVEVDAKEPATEIVAYAEPVPKENVTEDESTRPNTAIETVDTPLLSVGEVVAKVPETASTLPMESGPLIHADKQVEITEVGATPASVDEIAVKEQITTPVNPLHDSKTQAITEPAAQFEENKAEDNPIVESKVAQISTQQLHVTTTADKVLNPVSLLNLPETPRSAVYPKVSVLTPPTTPRKRATSQGFTKNDKDVLDELQASVRSREKKRKEQERIQAAEKERQRRELSLKVEKEIQKAGNFADGDEVLREVRSWRKQREASLKRSPDDAAKLAAYREAFTREEIMLELQSAVQSRSARGPYTEDPAEKRQELLLEELFARRVPAMQA